MSITSTGLGHDGSVAVSPTRAKIMLDLGLTSVYALIGSGELESFRIGKSRRITTRSIYALVERKLAAEASDGPKAV
jgi:hypothetical protein